MTQVELARALVGAGHPCPRGWTQEGAAPGRCGDGMRWEFSGGGWLPDLTDAATGGILLERLAEYEVDRDERGVRVRVKVGDDWQPARGVWSATLAEAAARALIALGSTHALLHVEPAEPGESTRTSAPMSELSVCAPFDSKRRTKPGRCASGVGECS